MSAQVTDNELVTAVSRGDAGALGVLFERHHARVHSLCYRMTGDPSVADDLVQESFLRVHRYAKGFRERAAFTTWLHRLVRNVCLHHLNAEARRHARVELMAGGQRAEARSGPGTVQPDEPAALQGGDPRLDTLRQALYSLPPDKREVLVLSRYEGLSYAEIADICETTVGAIKVRAHRAMRELRHRYEELEGTT
jgi:RNA polymerase sigma factor (sigma-70 family)